MKGHATEGLLRGIARSASIMKMLPVLSRLVSIPFLSGRSYNRNSTDPSIAVPIWRREVS